MTTIVVKSYVMRGHSKALKAFLRLKEPRACKTIEETRTFIQHRAIPAWNEELKKVLAKNEAENISDYRIKILKCFPKSPNFSSLRKLFTIN